MIEAATAPAEEPRVVRAAATGATSRWQALRLPWALAAGWLVFVVGLIWFLYAGMVRVGAGHWLGQRLRVRIIWSRFLGWLPDHGASPLLVGLVVAAAVLALVGGVALIWLAMTMRTEPHPAMNDPAATEPR
ncbi:MAG: hypothetical protein QM692_06540 [Thermomicrobiales bacterium]